MANAVNKLVLEMEALKVSGDQRYIRISLIDESVALLDELLLDPVFCSSLRNAHEPKEPGGNDEQLERFWMAEQELLAAAGFGSEGVRLIIDEARKAFAAGLAGSATPDEVFHSLIKLKHALMRARDNPAAEKHKRGSFVRTAAIALGGSALIVLNGTAWAATHGITTPLSKLSATLGGTLIGKSVGNVLDGDPPPPNTAVRTKSTLKPPPMPEKGQKRRGGER